VWEGLLKLQRSAGNRAVAGLLQRDAVTAPPAPGVPAATGEAALPEIKALLDTFASASGFDAKNAAGMQAVRVAIRAYSMSDRGVRTMRYKPDLDPKHGAETGEADDNPRESVIDFGPSSFSQGPEWLVHITAHELEHVRQNLIGGYASGEDPRSEFLAYIGSVLQVQNVKGRSGKGLLGALGPAAVNAPALPPLPPELLADQARRALVNYSKMPSADQREPLYRQHLASGRDKLLERLATEAPEPLRPPKKFTTEWTRWYEGTPPAGDPYDREYQEWLEAVRTPWPKVRDIWKLYDTAFKI
jgi:hypothetical protein